MVYAAPYDICRLQMVCVRQHCDSRCPGFGRHRASGTSAMPDAMGIHVDTLKYNQLYTGQTSYIVSKGIPGYCLVRTMENAAVADALWSNGVGLHVYVEFYKNWYWWNVCVFSWLASWLSGTNLGNTVTADALRSSVHWTSVTLICSTTRYPCMYACQTLSNSISIVI